MKSIALPVLFAGAASALTLGQRHKLVPPPKTAPDWVHETLSKREAGWAQYNSTFSQLIDHSKPELGTFEQRYWVTNQYWNGPGSPVVFFTPGEAAADDYTGYLYNITITGLFAEAIGGAVVLLEHRYWGTSVPVPNLSTENMQYLTLENAVHDNTYFAQNVRFPFDLEGTSAADKAPWVLSGGSYSGALSGWTYSLDPGTFWAYHASSAVVEAVGDFWQYFDPVRQGMPQNCSADIEKVVTYIDGVLGSGNEKNIYALQAQFGLESLEHPGDFVSVLADGPWAWQGDDFTTGYSSFFQFCDYVENAVPAAFSQPIKPTPQGVGLEKALAGYALWVKTIAVPGSCESYGYWTGEYNLDCFNSYNASSPIYTDISFENTVNRQWTWFLCNQPFEFWQDGAPEGYPTIISRYQNYEYWQRQCPLYFPEQNGFQAASDVGATPADVNAQTKGWFFTDTERLIWTNGQFDPWRDATVSSQFRPGGPLVSTPQVPVQVIPDGIHCSDLIADNGAANAGVQLVIDNEVAAIKGWVEEYYQGKY